MRQALVAALLAISIGLVAAGPTGDDPGSEADAVRSKLKSLCAGRPFPLKTVDELQALSNAAGKDSDACPPRVTEALRAMAAITDDRQACSMSKAKAITGFVADYLSGADADQEIPRALADFAVAYGMQVVKICSQEMVEKFAPHADARIYEKLGAQEYDKFKAFREYLIRESPIGVLLKPIVKTGEVVLPADLMQLAPEAGNLELVLNDEDAGWVKELCVNTLQPLYEPTLLPLAHLLRAGFNHMANFRRTLDKENGLFWSSAVFLCEIVKSVSVEASPQTPIDVQQLQAAAEGLAGREELKEEDKCVQQVHVRGYESREEVGNKVVSASVRPLVKAYEANRDEVERLRARIMSRGMKILGVMFKKGQYGPMLRQLLKLVREREGAGSKGFDEARAAIVEAVESSSKGDSCSSIKSLVRRSTTASVHEKKGEIIIGFSFGLIALILFLIGVFFGSIIKKRKGPPF